MSETDLCGYCVDLPEKGRADAVEVSRCPLCKAELGVSRGGQRFVIGEGTVPRRRRWSLLIVPALAGAAACSLAAVWMLRPPAEPIETVVVVPAPYVGPVTPTAESAPEQPRGVAVAKPYCEGARAALSRVKPQPPHKSAVEPDYSKA